MTDNHDDKRKMLERYLAGGMTEAEGTSFEKELLATDELSDELYADVSTVAALETAAEAHRQRRATSTSNAPWWQWQPLRWFLPAAAMATLVVFLVGRIPSGPEAPPVFRGTTEMLEVITPAGNVATPPQTFIWRRQADSAYFRFELFDAASTSQFTTVTAETSLVLDVSTVDIPRQGYWVLTPLDDLRIPSGKATTTRYQVTR